MINDVILFVVVIILLLPVFIIMLVIIDTQTIDVTNLTLTTWSCMMKVVINSVI